MPVFVLLSRHAQSGKSSFIFKECPRTIALAVVRAMHQWYLATSRQKTKAWICTTSIPSWTHWFLRFVRVSLRGVTSLSNPGVWDLTHWSQQGEVRCRKACRARPDRVRFAPFVRVRTTWNCRVADPIRKKIESLHGNYAAKCKTGFVACWWSKFDWSVFGMWVAPKSRVAWVNRVSWMKVPFQLPDLQFYEAARWCHILTEFCLIPLWDWHLPVDDPSIQGLAAMAKFWLTSGVQVMLFFWNLHRPVSMAFFSPGTCKHKRRGHSSSWNQAKRWPVVADGWKRRDRQLTSSDLSGNISGISSSDFDFCKMDSCHLMCLACKSCIR